MGEPSYAGRRVFVTGATGFIGTHLVRRLLAAGAEVHAIRRDPAQRTRLPAEGVVWHAGDILDRQSLGSAVSDAKPHVVFHLAAYGTVFEQQNHNLAFRTNVEGSLNLWRALDGFPCRFVHAGSCGEYGQASGQVSERTLCEPTWFYPATKNASVVLLSTLGRESGREIVTLRPFGPFGEADDDGRIIPHVIRSLLSGGVVRVTFGAQLRDFAHIDDHVKGFLLAGISTLLHNGAIYNIGSGKVVTVRSVIESIAKVVGGDALDRVEFGAIPYRSTEVWEMCCDISAARNDLGYDPEISLYEGIERTVRWFSASMEPSSAAF